MTPCHHPMSSLSLSAIQVGGVEEAEKHSPSSYAAAPKQFSHTRKNKEWGHARMPRKPLLFKRQRR